MATGPDRQRHGIRAPCSPNDFLSRAQVDSYLGRLNAEDTAALTAAGFAETAIRHLPSPIDSVDGVTANQQLSAAVLASLSAHRSLQDTVISELTGNAFAIDHAAHAFAPTAAAEDAVIIERQAFPAFVRFFLAYRIHCYFETSCLRVENLRSGDELVAEVVFVLGGPGAGKGTQCAKISKTFGYVHLSAGDLLREELKRPDSELGAIIKAHINEGKLVPAEITVKLLVSAMKMAGRRPGKFLIDGFPRSNDNLENWNRIVSNKVSVKFALFFECSEAAMEIRLLDRGQTSGRSDDNIETIKKRFRTFQQESLPVLSKLEARGLLRRVNADRSIQDVWRCSRGIFGPTLVFVSGGTGSGKTTICKKIEEAFGYKHIKIGSLLQEEAKAPGSKFAEYLQEGRNVPSDITVKVLLQELQAQGWAGGKYVVDGFPRSISNIEYWEKTVQQTAFVRHFVYVECTQGVMEARALMRAREDDTLESIRKKWLTFHSEQMPAVEHLKEKGLLRAIDGERAPLEVWDEVKGFFGPSVIFVLGGPGSGRITQCQRISSHFGYKHLRVGDLLREESCKLGSKLGELVARYIQEGKLVPSEVTVQVILSAMERHGWEEGKYLIDGFPKAIANWHSWKRLVAQKVKVRYAIFFDCPKDVMLERATSAQKMDVELFNKRMHIFQEESPSMLQLFQSDGILKTIDSNSDVHTVWSLVRQLFSPSVVLVLGGPGAGKQTMCSRISSHFGYHHMNVDDLLLDEIKAPDSEFGNVIQAHFDGGTAVPSEIIVKILERAMDSTGWEEGRYVIQGFPRNVSQWESWTRSLGEKVVVKAAVSLECSVQTMEERVLARSWSNGQGSRGPTFRESMSSFDKEFAPVLALLENNGALRRVNAEQDIESVWSCTKEVLHLELDPTLTNSAMIVLDPDACTKEVDRLVLSTLVQRQIAVLQTGTVAVSDLMKNGIFDQLYFAILDNAKTDPQHHRIMPDGQDRFKDLFGIAWADALRDNLVLSARTALTNFGMTAAQLMQAWRATAEMRLAHSIWVAKIPVGDTEKYVINGFAPSWRDEFAKKGDRIKWYAVEFSPKDCSWSHFRGEVIGHIDPAQASKTSLRGQMYTHWKDFALNEEPSVGRSGIQASRGPLEGLREWMLWFADDRPEAHPLGRSLMAGGVEKRTILSWLKNPQVVAWGCRAATITRNGSIFACTEDCDHSDFRMAAMRYAKAKDNGRGSHFWPVEVIRSLKDVATKGYPGSNSDPLPRLWSAGPKAKTITILHFNDVYNVEPRMAKDGSFKEPTGGISRFVTRVRELKAEAVSRGEPEAMCIFSGDAFNPSLPSTVTKGEHMVPALNAIGIQIACYGNHDFDFGVDELVHLASQTNFPWMISNVTEKASGKPLANGLVTRLIDWHGRRIGFIGLIEKEWLVTLHTLEPDDVHFEDFCVCARRLGRQLRNEGAEVVIALTHMRMPNDYLLANEVSEVDLILGGHDHHYEVKPVGPHGTYVLNSGTDFRDITELRLRFTDEVQEGKKMFEIVDSKHVQIHSSITEDPEMKELADKCMEKVGSAMNEVLGETAVDLDCRFEAIRTRETNIGNFITDVMRAGLKADIAVINSGTLRADAIIEKGIFRVRDLCNLLPMLDELCLLELSGAQVLNILQNSVSQYPRLEGRFLQVSGVTFTFDAEKPAGTRVAEDSIKIGDIPLDMGGTYRVCTLNFLRQGKDGFDTFKEATCLADGEQAGILPSIIREHFSNLSALNGLENANAYRSKRASQVRQRENLAPVGEGPAPMQRLGIEPRVEDRIVCLNPDPKLA